MATATRVTVSAKARQALVEADGNVQVAAKILTEWLEQDAALFQELMQPLIGQAVWAAIRKVNQGARNAMWTQQTKDDVTGLRAMAETTGNTIMENYRLHSGKRLGDATADDLREAIVFYETQARGNAKRALFLGMVLSAMGNAQQVRDALDEKRLGRMMVSAEQERVTGVSA